MQATHATSRVGTAGRQEHPKSTNVGRTERNASMIGGAALELWGLSKLTQKRIVPGLAMLVAGGMFLYRGKTGHCDMYEAIGVSTAGTEDTGVTVEKVLTINKAPQEVYEFWRNLENLPSFMRNLESVQITGANRSRWTAAGPGGVTVEWDAEMTEDIPGRRISWHSVEKADIPNEGTVEFQEAPGGRGTEVRVNITYHPPGGAAGKIAAKVAHAINAQQIEEDLKRLKQILETGETAKVEPFLARRHPSTSSPSERQREAL